MKTTRLVMGIDLGTSGVRIAVINEDKELIHTSEMSYPRGLSFSEDWEKCTTVLIQKIPNFPISPAEERYWLLMMLRAGILHIPDC